MNIWNKFIAKARLWLGDKNIIFALCCIVFIGILWMVPTGFQKSIYVNAEGVKGEIIDVDNINILDVGLVKTGDQSANVKILEGTFKGEKLEGVNNLTGSLGKDKIFKEGDIVYVLIEKNKDGQFIFANLVDYYRIDKEIMLALAFVIMLIIFSGSIGIRTVISFIFTFMCIVKVFIPMLLKGYHPIYLALCIGVLLSVITLLLIAGFTKKAYAAIIGTIGSSLITCILAVVVGNYFNIHGAVMEWSESLVYTGYENLNLTLIYQSGIYLSCLGAILDLSVDISAAIAEIVDKKPNISQRGILQAGLNIGKSVVGSQTTTLLLAYMGGFIGVMMVYVAQGTPIISILNTNFIASEIVLTLVGCIGLVIVSPFTSIVCSYMYKRS